MYAIRSYYGYDRLLVLILVSAVLLIAETAVIDTVLSGMHLVFGRLEAILAGDHIKGMMTHWGPYEPIDLIRRWGFLNETEYVSKVIYILFALVSVYVLIAARRYLV